MCGTTPRPASPTRPAATPEGRQRSNEGEGIEVTREGRCITIQTSLAGQVAMWVAAVALMSMGTFGDVEDARGWALLCATGAASWTVIYVLARQHRLMEQAFDLGRAVGERSMRPVR